MFSKNLKYFRLKNNMNMRELAKQVGVTNMAISNYEKGIRTPDMLTIHKLAAALKVNAIDFMLVRNEELKFRHGAFRKNSTMSKSKQEYVREATEEYFNRYFNIINILGECVLPTAPESRTIPLSADDEVNAGKMREWLGVAVEGSVGNMVDIIENKGILIYIHEVDDSCFSARK